MVYQNSRAISKSNGEKMQDFILRIAKEDLVGKYENVRLRENFLGTNHESLIGTYLVIGRELGEIKSIQQLDKHTALLLIEYELEDEDLYFVPFLLSYRLLRSSEEYTEESFKDQEIIKSTTIAIKILASKIEQAQTSQPLPEHINQLIKISLVQNQK